MLICFSCQFVVKEDGDIKANLLDPDIPLKWEHIEEVVSIYNLYLNILLCIKGNLLSLGSLEFKIIKKIDKVNDLM